MSMRGAADGEPVGGGRLPGEGQRPVRPPREHRLAPPWWVRGGVALAVVGVVGLSILVAGGLALPATSVVLALLVPVGIGIALRGFALQRISEDREREGCRPAP
ncbi:hypothetical protein [Agrococcus sp. SGAir0287]|uniref:hypothetical protein n=1 Tax=Agrococcus sp. SGAir0287 TaxID=2070347 RepID=UPI0010CD5264|nr:hypothetical protein [Agrococcus sp. SGAir0287]QCR20418.1 hypothetical protein C1N71_14000 [Agrococcus sp. SGAir0287]